MLRVLVICGSTRGREGHIPPTLLVSFLEVMRLRVEGLQLQIVLHDDSPLTREESAEQFCLVRPWAEIREMFASVQPDVDDLVLVLEHRESGAVFAELADTLERIRRGERPKLGVFFASDSKKTDDDAVTSWGPEVKGTMCWGFFTYESGNPDYPLSTFVAAFVGLVTHHEVFENMPAIYWCMACVECTGEEAPVG